MNPEDPNAPYGGQQPGQPYGGQPYGGQQPGGYPQGGQQFGGGAGFDAPYPGGAYPGGVGGAEPEAPVDVIRSFQLWLAYVGISLVSLAFAFLQPNSPFNTISDQMADELTAAGTPVSAEELDGIVTGGIVVGLVVALALIAFHVFLIFKMRAGRNWARIFMTVVSVFVVIASLFGLFMPGGPLWTTLLSVIQLGVLLGALYFMWTRSATEYFKAHTLFRQSAV